MIRFDIPAAEPYPGFELYRREVSEDCFLFQPPSIGTGAFYADLVGRGYADALEASLRSRAPYLSIERISTTSGPHVLLVYDPTGGSPTL